MVICCPECQSQYRIDPASCRSSDPRVKCPDCAHVFQVHLASETPVLPRVLIVDDAKFFREMIKDILKDLPVELTSSADGEDAWQQVKALRPQLVLLDLNIPGISGKELLQMIRQDPELCETKVFMMSGVERGDEVATEVLRSGADYFFSKSFKPDELMQRVRETLGL